MKTKHLAMENGDLTGSSIGDAMSALAETGWLEYELQVSIRHICTLTTLSTVMLLQKR